LNSEELRTSMRDHATHVTLAVFYNFCKMLRSISAIVVTSLAAFGQPAFEVASVRPGKSIVGHDGVITTDPVRFTARNATLKRLIFEAYSIPYSQISGGPGWLDSNEFDIDAKPENPASLDQLRLMLRTLLTERFKLAIHRESKERSVYELLVGKDGPRLKLPGKGSWRFHGDLSQFAGNLAIQLTIPLLEDPGTPSRASGAPVPVIDKTGIQGVFDIAVDIKPDAGASVFTIWQRALQEQLGLKLVSGKAPVEIIVIDSAEKVLGGN
jgi:uncharacterized protein (TIGR03435 family)